MERQRDGVVSIGEAYGRSSLTTAFSRRTMFLAVS